MLKQSQSLSLQEILDISEKLIQAQEMTKFVGSVRIPLEMVLVRLTLPVGRNPLPAGPPKQQNYPVDDTRQEIKSPAKTIEKNPIKVKSEEKEPQGEKESRVNVSINLDQVNQIWPEVLKRIAKVRMSVATYLQEGSLEALDKNKVTICFPLESKFHKESLEHKDNTKLIQDVLREISSANLQVAFSLAAEASQKQADDAPLLKSTLDTFKGKVVGRWYKRE